MSRFDFRWMGRHPLRWVRVMWLQWAACLWLIGLAWVSDQPVFSPVIAQQVWPILLGGAAFTAAVSAVAPLDQRVQGTAAAILFGVSVLRMAGLLDAWIRAELSAGGQTLALTFALHWAFAAMVSLWWPTLTEAAGRVMTAEAGRDDRGGS